MSYTLPSCNGDPCTLCGGTGMRMDIAAQIVRIEDPTYTCNGCKGTRQAVYFPILSADSHLSQEDIDSAAESIVHQLPARIWREIAQKADGDHRAIYERCVEIQTLRETLEEL